MRFRGPVLGPNVRLVPRRIPRGGNIRPSFRSLSTDEAAVNTHVTGTDPALAPQAGFKTDIKGFFELLNKQQQQHHVDTASTASTADEPSYVSVLEPTADGAKPTDEVKGDRINRLLETTPVENLLCLPFAETSQALKARWINSDFSVAAYVPRPLLLSGEVYQLDKKSVLEYLSMIRHQVARQHCLDEYRQGRYIKMLMSPYGEPDKVLRLYREETAYLSHMAELYNLSKNEQIKQHVLETLPLMVDLVQLYGLKRAKVARLESALKTAQNDFSELAAYEWN
jgi:hypothetical protein